MTLYVLTNGLSGVAAYPYSLDQLRRDNPNVSFPAAPTAAQLAEWNVFEVTPVNPPSFNLITQNLAEANPLPVSDGWAQQWSVTPASAGEIAERTASYQNAASIEAARLLAASDTYLSEALLAGKGLTAAFLAYRAALAQPQNLSGYPISPVWPTLPAQIFDAAQALPIDAYTKSQADTVVTATVATATSSLAAKAAKVLYLDAAAATGSVTTAPLIANALASIGNTNGFTIQLSFGEFREPGPIVVNDKWQLQIHGPQSASTTAVTIKNGLTIQNSNGVRMTRVQVEGASSISSRAGLGLHFERCQFMGATTIGGTGGFMTFTDCEFANNVTIPANFAGAVFFIRCSFGAPSGVYTFSQNSAQQAIFYECSGIPNAGIARASFSGTTTFKNNSQAFFLNGVAISNAGATNGQVLRFNGTSWAPATLTATATDATKLPLAGGTLTGPLVINQSEVDALDIKGNLIVRNFDGNQVFDINADLSTIAFTDPLDPGTNVVMQPGGVAVSQNDSLGMQIGLTNVYAGTIELRTSNEPSIPSAPQQVATKAYVDASATTGARPTDPAVGQHIFDTTLSKPIWWSGESWVDANGTVV